jgi:hypothetical protein
LGNLQVKELNWIFSACFSLNDCWNVGSHFIDCLRYSLFPSERMLAPFKKARTHDSRRKCLDEVGMFKTS